MRTRARLAKAVATIVCSWKGVRNQSRLLKQGIPASLHLKAPTAASKGDDSAGNPSKSAQNSVETLQYSFGLNKEASAIWWA